MTYVIVGASAGLGLALASRFALAGHDLILVASDARDLRAVTADLVLRHGVRVRWVAADVSGNEAYLEQIASAADELGSIDGMLFPVGAVTASDDCSFDPGRVARLTRINYEAVVSAVTRFLPELLARPNVTIVGFGTVAATRGRRRNVTYAAAKAALRSFFESLRHACTDSNVTVQFYVLGYLDTASATGIRVPVPKGNSAALSARVLRDLPRDIAVAYYPRFWGVLCAMLRWAPWFAFKRLNQ
jgi:short-subunit dehydrogenase